MSPVMPAATLGLYGADVPTFILQARIQTLRGMEVPGLEFR